MSSTRKIFPPTFSIIALTLAASLAGCAAQSNPGAASFESVAPGPGRASYAYAPTPLYSPLYTSPRRSEPRFEPKQYFDTITREGQ